MTNNLKILTILSIFVFILTGYFCFSSSFTKNQIIANNNEEEKKDGKETTIDTNNKDNNNNEDNENSKLSILSIIVLIVILIVIVGIIIFIIVNFSKSKSEIEEEPEVEVEFKIRKESKEDFAKDNFCPTFFLIKPSSAKGKSEKDGKYFFEILTQRIMDKINKKINRVIIFLDADDNGKLDNGGYNNVYITTLGKILDEIAEFAAFTESVTNKDIDKITASLEILFSANFIIRNFVFIKEIYSEEFDSYLCSYLLRYLAEDIANAIDINVEINKPNIGAVNEKTTYFNDNDNDIAVLKEYHVNYSVMDKILEKLLKDKPLKNVEYS